MAVATFDTLKFANTLKSAGVPPAQAEAQASAFAEVIQINLKEVVTKDDLKREIDSAVKELKQEIKESEQRTNAKLDESGQRTNAKFDTEIAKLRGDMALLKWMIGVGLTMGTAVLIRLFFFRSPM